jgi:hypothetical protein
MSTCDAAVRGHLEPAERVLSIGRCEDITQRGSIDSGGAAWTYIMVTDRRLRWVPNVDLRFEASLDLDDVRAVAEEHRAHRYAITLEHVPCMRPHWVPAHRFLGFRSGDAVSTNPLPRTKLAFSRRDTEAAVALRDQLANRREPAAKWASALVRRTRPVRAATGR